MTSKITVSAAHGVDVEVFKITRSKDTGDTTRTVEIVPAGVTKFYYVFPGTDLFVHEVVPGENLE